MSYKSYHKRIYLSFVTLNIKFYFFYSLNIFIIHISTSHHYDIAATWVVLYTFFLQLSLYLNIFLKIVNFKYKKGNTTQTCFFLILFIFIIIVYIKQLINPPKVSISVSENCPVLPLTKV